MGLERMELAKATSVVMFDTDHEVDSAVHLRMTPVKLL
jgi:hypothetical protein